MSKIGLFVGSTTGKTKSAAEMIQEEFGGEKKARRNQGEKILRTHQVGTKAKFSLRNFQHDPPDSILLFFNDYFVLIATTD